MTDRQFTVISQEEFEDLLVSVDERFRLVTAEDDPMLQFTRELVYGINLDDEVQLRVYSTIDERTGKVRDKGEDAIRTVIWSRDYDRPIAGRTKTLRIKTWRKNLAPKLRELLDEWELYKEECNECGALMTKRSGEYGEFYGCMKYPACNNTKQVEQVESESLSEKEVKDEEREVMEEAGYELEEEEDDFLSDYL